MENRNEPLSSREWYITDVANRFMDEFELMQEYADYIKSFQPAVSPIDWEKLKVQYKEWYFGSAGRPPIYDIFDWFKQRTGGVDNSVVDNWISVNEVDKLPYKKGLVLFLVNNIDVYVGTLHHGEFQIWGLGRPQPTTDMNVTHWQPLPYVPPITESIFLNQKDKK